MGRRTSNVRAPTAAVRCSRNGLEGRRPCGRPQPDGFHTSIASGPNESALSDSDGGAASTSNAVLHNDRATRRSRSGKQTPTKALFERAPCALRRSSSDYTGGGANPGDRTQQDASGSYDTHQPDRHGDPREDNGGGAAADGAAAATRGRHFSSGPAESGVSASVRAGMCTRMYQSKGVDTDGDVNTEWLVGGHQKGRDAVQLLV